MSEFREIEEPVCEVLSLFVDISVSEGSSERFP